MKNTVESSDYLRPLERWLLPAGGLVSACPGRPDLEFYGTGYGGWGVQTNQKAFAAFAVLAADPGLDEGTAGASREQVLSRALKLLRFSLESHIEGNFTCTDGSRWGHTWISMLGIERMMHGVEALDEHLRESDIALMRKVFLSESDWLLDDYRRGSGQSEPGRITAGRLINNFPENNLWSGAFLHRTAALFPGAPRAEEYREKGTRFLANSISVASDALSEKIIDGRPLSELYEGDNFFESFALNHHGYLNIGYMAICLSNAAMLHFSFRRLGMEPPEALYHHAEDLWKLLKMCVFPDGRLMRIGGDTRVRYCYCQDYLVPVLLLACDFLKDGDCPALEKGWLEQVKVETAANADGSFLSKRCSSLREISPLYYTRLESDRAATLSMGAYWRRIFDIPGSVKDPGKPASGSWSDACHGAYLARSGGRAASWVWRAAQPPQGLCLPPGCSSMAEWKQNLAGEIKGTGRTNFQEVISHGGRGFRGGFITWGDTLFRSETMVAEGQPDEVTAIQRVVSAALPDDRTMMVMQRAKTGRGRVYLRSVKGIFLQVPNDVFNGFKRSYFFEEGALELEGPPAEERIVRTGSTWMNIDNRLSLITPPGSPGICIFRTGARQVGLRNWPAEENPLPGGMLYADEICSPLFTGLTPVNPDTLLYDTAFILKPGMDSESASSFAKGSGCFRPAVSGGPGTGALAAKGEDGLLYLLCSNFMEEPAEIEVKLPFGGRLEDLSSGEEYPVDASGAARLRLEGKTPAVYIIPGP